MQYNVLKNALTDINTTSGTGTVTFTGSQIKELLDVSETSIKTLIADLSVANYDKLDIEFDLGVRLHSSEIRYYFGSDVVNTAVASGVYFKYKNEAFQEYSSLPTYVANDYYYTNVSGMLAPRYVQLIHNLEETDGFLTTLSGYIEGDLYGIEMYNDDTYVDFGTDGTIEGGTVTIAREGTPDIRSIAIYNSSQAKATAYISLDPTYTDLDKVLSISATENGEWVHPLDEEFAITKTTINGVNIELKNGVICLIGYLDANDKLAINVESGSYISEVFLNDCATWNSIIVDRITPLNGFLQTDSDDGIETIQVISSNFKPKSYNIYREFYVHTAGVTDYLRYRDRWVETDQIKTEFSTNLLSATYHTTWRDFFITIDPITERWAGFVYHYADSPSVTAQWYLLNIDSEDNVVSKLMVQQAEAATEAAFDWKYLKLDHEGGLWVYFYAVFYNDSDFINESGYFLYHFDKDFNVSFRQVSVADFVGVMDVVYTMKYLWYTIPESNQIQKLKHDGTVLYNHLDNTNNLGGLCVLPDGSLWYANNSDLYYLQDDGVMDATKTLLSVADEKFTFIVPEGDGTEALWVLENNYVSRILLYGENKGQKDFSIYVDDAVKLYPVDSGVWVWSTGTYMRYISKANRRIENADKLDYNSTPGVLEHTYEDELYISKMPLAIDNEWSNLEWKKVNTESFILPEDNYHQVKITLRRQSSYQKHGGSVLLDSVFHTDDDFNQSATIPDVVVWGEYLDSSRVYIENEQLTMLSDLMSSSDSFINTKNRYVLTGDFDVQFDYIMGGGVQTNKSENIYLYAYATDAGVLGQYLMSRIHIPELSTSTSYIYYYVNGSSSQTSLLADYDRWVGKLRLKRDGDNVCGYVWDPQTTSWIGGCRSGVDLLGNYFYFQIATAKDGSNIYIDNFIVNEGTAYYYSDTPKVKGVYVQKDIKLENIYPNTSKNVYLKSSVSSGMDVIDHYDTSLKVRWRTSI